MKNRNKISRLILDRYVLDDLDPQKKNEIDQLMKEDESLRNQIHNIKNESRIYLNEFPDFEKLSNTVKKESKNTLDKNIKLLLNKFEFYPLRLAYFGVAILCIYLLVFPFNIFKQPEIDSNDQFSTKGNSEINLIIKRSENIFIVTGNEVICQPLDTLQFIITSDRLIYYAIFSCGDDDKIHKYLPQNETPLLAGSEKGDQVAGSLIIEEDGKDETIFFVFSDSVFSMGSAKQRINEKNGNDKSLIKKKQYLLKHID